jgi:hypothetical protein
MGYKTYTAIIEFDVSIKDNALIVQNADSVTAAVRHLARQMLPTGWRRNGMLVQAHSVHVEAKEKEPVA